eukprot:7382191-Heterocapsa_arctica.AAC.1
MDAHPKAGTHPMDGSHNMPEVLLCMYMANTFARRSVRSPCNGPRLSAVGQHASRRGADPKSTAG